MTAEPMISGPSMALGVVAMLAAPFALWLGGAIHSRFAKLSRHNARREIHFLRESNSGGHWKLARATRRKARH